MNQECENERHNHLANNRLSITINDRSELLIVFSPFGDFAATLTATISYGNYFKQGFSGLLKYGYGDLWNQIAINEIDCRRSSILLRGALRTQVQVLYRLCR